MCCINRPAHTHVAAMSQAQGFHSQSARESAQVLVEVHVQCIPLSRGHSLAVHYYYYYYYSDDDYVCSIREPPENRTHSHNSLTQVVHLIDASEKRGGKMALQVHSEGSMRERKGKVKLKTTSNLAARRYRSSLLCCCHIAIQTEPASDVHVCVFVFVGPQRQRGYDKEKRE